MSATVQTMKRMGGDRNRVALRTANRDRPRGG
jgi:hypothetical protein